MRTFYPSAVIGLAGLTMASIFPVMANAQTNWRLTTFASDTSAYYNEMTLPFIERVEQLTGGDLTIEPFAEGIIAPAFEAYAAVRDGLADAGHLTPLYVVNEHPANDIFAGHPGGMDPVMMLGWFYEGGGQELLQELRAKEGMFSLVVTIGPAEIWHSHVPINTAEDLRGLRFRASGAWAEVLDQYFGAAATTVPGGEVYTLLERRGIDVAEWSTPAENAKIGLQNAAPYIITPGAHSNSWPFEMMVSLEAWEALPETTRAQVEAAAKLSTMESLLNWVSDDIAAMEDFRAGSAEVMRLPDEVVQAIGDAGRQWAEAKAEEYEGQGDDYMRRVVDSYYAYRDGWDSVTALGNTEAAE